MRNSISLRENETLGTDIRYLYGSAAKCSGRLDGRRGRIPCHEPQRPSAGGRRILTTGHGDGIHGRWVLLSNLATRPSTEGRVCPAGERARATARDMSLTCVKYEKYMTELIFRKFALLAFPT